MSTTEPTEESVRSEVGAWLKANWNPNLGLVEWREKLCESGWGAPHWPTQWYGRDLPVKFNAIVDEEFAKVGAVAVAKAGIRTLAAATILAHGTDLHKEKFLKRILTGEDTWCQLFSEPGSGSDMAGAVTRADKRGQQVGDQRPEGLDHLGAQGALGPAAGARRLGQGQAQGPRLLRPRHEAARRPGPSAEADERPRLVQPGVLHRRAGRARDDDLRRGRRLDGGDHHADARAARRRRPAQLGHALGRQGPHLRGGARRDRDHDGAVQMVSAARRPGRPRDVARQRDRQDQ